MSSKTDLTESELDSLVEELKADPEKALTADLTDEDLLVLQKKINPYAHIAGPGRDEETPTVIAASYTNLKEDYITRFVMTGMVGFIFRMLSEWKIEPEQRRWKPAKAKGEKKPFTLEEIKARAAGLTDLAGILEDKQKIFDAAKEAVKEMDKDMVLTEEEMKDYSEAMKKEGPIDPAAGGGKIAKMQKLLAAARAAEDEYLGILYTTTMEMRGMGIEADLRIPQTEEEAKKFPKCRSVIEENPNRFRGILPAGQQEMPERLAKDLIRSFLENYFETNPDAHVRGAYDEAVINVERKNVDGLPETVLVDPHDPDRLPLNVLLTAAPPSTTKESDQAPLKEMIAAQSADTRQRDYNTICHLLEDERLAGVANYVTTADAADPDRRDRWRRMLLPEISKDVVPAVPPQDTFHRWRYYMDVNMEALRAATATIYHEKPSLDFAIHVMDSFQGSPAEVKEWGEKFRDENQDRVISDIKLIEQGAWVLLGEFETNRQKANIFNRQTDILKRILDRHEEDKKLGSLLMRQRVRKTKAKNIAKEGPDAPGLSSYKANFPTEGAKEVLSAADRRRLERARGDMKAAKELEYIEAYERRAKELESKARFGELSEDDRKELKACHEEIAKAEEMLEVPDDAIQVDVLTHDTKTGKMRKSKIFTKAAARGEAESDVLTRANVSRAQAVQQVGADAAAGPAAEEANPDDPAAFYPTKAAQTLARRAFKEGKAAPPLSGFAQNFLEEDLARERKAEAAKGDDAEAIAKARLGAEKGDLAGQLDSLLDGVAEKGATADSA